MSPVEARLHALEGFTVPRHLHEFAAMSAGILDNAHTQSLQVDLAVLTATTEKEFFQSYIERTRIEHPLDYEKYTVRLGRCCLMVTFDHRHIYDNITETLDAHRYPRSTVAFQNDTVKLYRSGIRGLRDEDITENKEVGLEVTNQLYHTLGVLGVRYSLEDTASRDQYVA